MELSALLEAIPAAATSAQALAAYLAVTIAFTFVAWKNSRYKSLLERLRHLPEADRAQALRDEMGIVLPESISALNWLRSRRQTYFLVAFLAVLAAIVVIFSMAMSSAKSGAGTVTIQASTDYDKPRELCTGTIDVAINNNSASTILLTEVALVPDWLYAYFSAGETSVSATYNVLLEPWLEDAMGSSYGDYYEESPPSRKRLTKKLA